VLLPAGSHAALQGAACGARPAPDKRHHRQLGRPPRRLNQDGGPNHQRVDLDGVRKLLKVGRQCFDLIGSQAAASFGDDYGVRNLIQRAGTTGIVPLMMNLRAWEARAGTGRSSIQPRAMEASRTNALKSGAPLRSSLSPSSHRVVSCAHDRTSSRFPQASPVLRSHPDEASPYLPPAGDDDLFSL